MEKKKITISVVVPVYCAEKTLPELEERLRATLTMICSEYEIILVNDGSTDESWKVIASLAEKNSDVRGINLMRNYGQHNALLAGLRNARYEICATMDDDLQHDPACITVLLAKLQKGFDVVDGAPMTEKHGL